MFFISGISRTQKSLTCQASMAKNKFWEFPQTQYLPPTICIQKQQKIMSQKNIKYGWKCWRTMHLDQYLKYTGCFKKINPISKKRMLDIGSSFWNAMCIWMDTVLWEWLLYFRYLFIKSVHIVFVLFGHNYKKGCF